MVKVINKKIFVIWLITINLLLPDCNLQDGFVDNPLYPVNSTESCIPEDFVFNSSSQLAGYLFTIVLLHEEEVDSDDWVGAFNGNVCVGARKWDTNNCGQHICDVPVNGFDGSELTAGYMENGQVPTFKIFDASVTQYYSALPSENYSWSFLSSPLITTLQGCEGSHDWDIDGICDNVDTCIGAVDPYTGNCLDVTEPLQFTLSQNYPNPFNPITSIEFSLEVNNYVILNIYNSRGEKVKNLLNEYKTKGIYNILWDGTDNNSQKLPSSNYILIMHTDNAFLSKKMTIIK